MIDIIIPAYNAHKTIHRTLLSIMYQKNIKELNVYIINDASNSGYSSEVNYFSKYFKIKEFKIKNNKGPGYARNYGLKHSKSKYVMFIDSDDVFYSPLSIITLKKEIEKTKSDLVISNYISQNSNHNFKNYYQSIVGLHGKIYRREYIEKNKISFPFLYAEEDTAFNKLCFLYNPKISYLDVTTYIYLYNNESITNINNQKYYEDNNQKYIESSMYVLRTGIKNNGDKSEIAKLSFKLLLFIFFETKIDNNILLSELYNIYNRYKNNIDEIDEIFNNYSSNHHNLNKKSFSTFLDKISGGEKND